MNKFLENPWRIFNVFAARGRFRWMPDDLYLRLCYRASLGKKLDLKNPQTYTEKLQWLKLHNRKPEYSIMVDKYRVRDYIREQLGEEYLIPLLGVWNDPDEINFDELPDKFVLKCNHNSGLGMCICKDKSKLDIPKVKEELRKGLDQNYYLTGREWPYKEVPRKIICEKYMTDSLGECQAVDNRGLTDYKFFCFDGTAKVIMVASDRFSGKRTHFDYFDREYTHLPMILGDPPSEIPPEKPKCLDKMLEIADQLSAGMPHVRVDLYCVNGKIYFGELTFFAGSGFERISPNKWDYELGSWIQLSQIQK